jgi:hypothetical protein
MVFDSGTATSSGQVTTSVERVRSIEWHARSGNTASVYVGVSDVSSTNGRELEPGEAVTWNFSLVKQDASVTFSSFYVDIAGGDKVDWSVIKE